MKKQNAHTMSSIYDKLNDQPHLQDIIKQQVLEQLVKDEASKASKITIDELKYYINDIKNSYFCDTYWTNPKSNHEFASYLLWQFKNIYNQ
jgi:hypothetical protein